MSPKYKLNSLLEKEKFDNYLRRQIKEIISSIKSDVTKLLFQPLRCGFPKNVRPHSRIYLADSNMLGIFVCYRGVALQSKEEEEQLTNIARSLNNASKGCIKFTVNLTGELKFDLEVIAYISMRLK